VRKAIRRELGRAPRDIFRWVDERPLASASIAQVHRATLHDGRQVVIKVQHPGIGDLMAGDLALLRVIVSGITAVAPTVRLQPILDHLEQTLPLELDFKREAWAMQELRAALRHRKDVLVPEPIPELSTGRLLTMDYVEGTKITDKAGLAKEGLATDAVARLLNDVYAEQMLRLGWLHADPHPGNLLVQPGSDGPRLVLLDHGLTVPLPPALIATLQEMVRALHAGDLPRLADALRRAGMPHDAEVDIATLLQIVGVLLDQPGNHGRSDALAIGQRLGQGIGSIPSDLILVGRALGLLDGVTRQLDPGLDTLEIISSYVDDAEIVFPQ
jgi:ubiquinone biosynthesis protein